MNFDVEQGSETWKALRAGYVTASRMGDVTRKPKRGQKESTTRKAYVAQLVCERLTGRPQEQEFETWDMKRGVELEPLARSKYEMVHDVMVAAGGFVEHARIPSFGCSPDGLIGTDGLCQIKCPRAHVHIGYLRAGVVPAEYRSQMLAELACTGRKWNDFVSYNRDFPDHLQLFVVRLARDESEITEIEDEVRRFLVEVDETISALPAKAGENVLERQLRQSLEIGDAEVARV